MTDESDFEKLFGKGKPLQSPYDALRELVTEMAMLKTYLREKLDGVAAVERSFEQIEVISRAYEKVTEMMAQAATTMVRIDGRSSSRAVVAQNMINRSRISGVRWGLRLDRTIISVNPSVVSEGDAGETGIIVVSRGIDGHGYVLADLSCDGHSSGWGRVVGRAYDHYGAKRIVSEKNQGGDMTEAIIRSFKPNIVYKGITAKVDKKIRTEPVAALYEQGKISHVGVFPVLEDEWTQRRLSSNRVDALVQGVIDLGLIGPL